MRVIIADDHPLFRSALAAAVRRAGQDAEIVETSCLADAIAAVKAAPTALILLDLSMGDTQAMSGLINMRAVSPTTPIIVVSAYEDTVTVERALSCGAADYVTKSAPLNNVVDAILRVLAGEVRTPAVASTKSSKAPLDAVDRVASLTPAQKRVLLGIAEGRLNKQIAYEMSISEATVKAHVTAIFRKLHVVNRTQALLAAKEVLLTAPA
jgi:DNA-binding NarL/FixJ family response regulator